MFKRLLLIFFILGTFFMLSDQALAFSISPLRYDLIVDPGTKSEVVVKIKNTEKEDKIFNFKIFGIEQKEDGQTVFLQGIDDAETWVRPNINNIELKSGEEYEVVFEITTPPNTYPKMHYLGLAAESVSGEGQVGLGGRLICILSLQIAGVANEDLEIVGIKPEKGFYINKDWSLDLSLKNRGNVSLDLSGDFNLTNWKGELIADKELRFGNELLPQSIRNIEPKIDHEEIKDLFWPGIYKFTGVVNFGQVGELELPVVSFWYFPIWFLISSLIVLFLILGLVFVFKKNK